MDSGYTCPPPRSSHVKYEIDFGPAYGSVVVQRGAIELPEGCAGKMTALLETLSEADDRHRAVMLDRLLELAVELGPALKVST